jgi:pyruvate,water dikinase
MAQHPVPPGFCLAAAPASGDPPSINLYARLAAAYADLGRRCGSTQPRVAVRSSAVDEDGPHASFAGLHETYLNVIGPEAVTDAVRRCLASAYSERALRYRRHQGLGETARVAVLVQQLVVADTSAVVFSADPRTGDRDHVLINATWGLGESLVGGSVTPDLYVVRKDGLRIVERQVADKHVMTIMRPEGTLEVPVPRCLRGEPVLETAQVLALAELACVLERTQGWPVDLECAYQGESLYLLQCRPVTTG